MTRSSITSDDGTRIGYRQLGRGPAVVVLHGMMSSGYHHIELAGHLSGDFTVFLPDRRGRGLSGPYRDGHCAGREVEDLGAILRATGATRVVGVSIGAIIALEAALTVADIEKLALYEPPFFVPGPAPTAWIERFDREIADGKTGAALMTGMKASQLGPPFLNLIPRWLLERMTNVMLSREKSGAEYVSMTDLAPTLHQEGHVVAEMNDDLERFGGVAAEVLLLGGSKSPAYMKHALDALEGILPIAGRVELPGLDHGASWNRDRRGQPAPVADELRRFLV